jgi:hypothetical protein
MAMLQVHMFHHGHELLIDRNLLGNELADYLEFFTVTCLLVEKAGLAERSIRVSQFAAEDVVERK